MLTSSTTQFSFLTPAFVGVAGKCVLVGFAIAAPLLHGHGASAPLAASLVLAIFLTLLSACDWLSFRLPDVLTYSLLVIGLLLAADAGKDALLWSAFSASLAATSLYVVGWIYRRVRSRAGLGMGDVKLLAAAGAWVGAESLTTILLVACIAALSAIALTVRRGAFDASQAIPFGPFLALGIWVAWLYGPVFSDRLLQ